MNGVELGGIGVAVVRVFNRVNTIVEAPVFKQVGAVADVVARLGPFGNPLSHQAVLKNRRWVNRVVSIVSEQAEEVGRRLLQLDLMGS